MRKAILVKTGKEIDVIRLGIPVKYEISDDFSDEFGNAFNFMIGENGFDFGSNDEYLNAWLIGAGKKSFPCVFRVALFLTPGAAAVNDYVLYNNTMFKMCNDRTAISIGSVASGIIYNYDAPDLKVLLERILRWDFDNNSDKISDWKEMGRIGFCPSLPAVSATLSELYDNLSEHGIYTRKYSNQFWMQTAEKLLNTGIELAIYNYDADPDEEDDPYLDCIICTIDGFKETEGGAEITFKLVKEAKLAGTVDFSENNNKAHGFLIASYFEDHSPKKQERKDAIVNVTEKLTSTSGKQSICDVINVGNTLMFGRYIQDAKATNREKGIEWIVLDKNGTSILVISKYALDVQPYNNSFTKVTWETCSLRKWLNETFFSTAFSSDEQEVIRNTTVTADKNPSFDTSSGNNTMDKVFLLSITEADKYFTSDGARQCTGTEYCYAQGALKDVGCCYWWLRSPGDDSFSAALVNYRGSVFDCGNQVIYSNIAVRPALWIDLGI